MVLSDPFRPHDVSRPAHSRSPLVIDRLAAFAIDWFCFSFTTFLILAPMKRNMMIARILEHEDDFVIGYSLSIALVFCWALMYNTFFLAWKGATPGKLLMKLQVVDVWSQGPLSFTSAFVRSFAWCLSCACLCIPHFEIFTNGRRRPLYDRLADTEVVSLSGRYAEKPSGGTIRFAKMLLLAFGLLLGSFLLHDLYNYARMSGEIQKWKEELAGVSPNSCSEVAEAQDAWQGGPTPSRLTLALALYSANNLDSECLGVEAFKAFQGGDEVELAYLAKSFIHSDDADLSDEYLKRVCFEKEKSEACEFSKMIELWASQNIEDAGVRFEKMLETSSIYVRVWAVKHFERTKNFAEEIKILDDLWETKGLTSFVNTHRGVAYWGLHRRDEARVAIASAISEVEGTQRLEISSWFCYRELADSCSSVRSPACAAFINTSEEIPDRFSNSGHLLTYLKANECKAKSNLDYEEIASRSPDQQGIVFVKAIQSLNSNDKSAAIQVLKPILFDENWDRAYKDEAIRRLVSVVDTQAELKEVMGVWAESDSSSWEWRMEGLSLLRELIKRKIPDLALAVGEQLAQSKSLPEEDLKDLVIYSYQNGNHRYAFDLIKKPGRRPASSNPDRDEEYESVTFSLLKEFQK